MFAFQRHVLARHAARIAVRTLGTVVSDVPGAESHDGPALVLKGETSLPLAELRAVLEGWMKGLMENSCTSLTNQR